MARASAGVVAFLWGPSRGSVFTVREAIRAGKPAAVVLAGGGRADRPALADGLAPLGIEISELPITPDRLFHLFAASTGR